MSISPLFSQVTNYTATLQLMDESAVQSAPSQTKIIQITNSLTNISPADLQKATPAEARAILTLIAELEAKGVSNLGTLKAQVTLLARPQEKKSVSSQEQLLQSLTVAPSSTTATTSTSSLLFGVEEEEESHALAIGLDTIHQFLEGRNKLDFIQGLLDFSGETYTDALAEAEASGHGEIDGDNIITQAKSSFQEILSRCTNGQLKALVQAMSDAPAKNLVVALINQLNSFAQNGLMGSVGATHLYTFSRVYTSLVDTLTAAVANRGITGVDIQSIQLDLNGETMPANSEALRQAIAHIQNTADNKVTHGCRELLDELAISTQISSVKNFLQLYHNIFPAGSDSPSSYRTFANTMMSHLKPLLATMSDQELDTLLHNMQIGENYQSILFYKGSTPNNIDEATSIDLQVILHCAKNEKMERSQQAALANHVYGLSAMDFTLPSFSPLENFGRAIRNFFRNIFTWGLASHNQLDEDAILARTRTFGKDNGQLVWLLKQDGWTPQDVIALFKENLLEHNPGLQADSAAALAEKMTIELIAGRNEWMNAAFGDIPTLPKEDLRRQVSETPLPELARKYRVDLSRLDAMGAVQLKSRLLVELNALAQTTADGTIPAEQGENTLKQLLSNAEAVLKAGLMGQITPEPADLTSMQDKALFLFSQIGQGFSKPQEFYTAASTLAQELNARLIMDAQLTHRGLGGEDQSRIRSNLFISVLNTLTEEQMRHLAKMVVSDDFCQLTYGLTAFNQDKSAGGPEEFDTYGIAINTEALLGQLRDSVICEMEKRHIATDFPLTAKQSAEVEELSAINKQTITAYTAQLDQAAIAKMDAQTESIIQTIANQQFADPAQLSKVMDNFISSTHVCGASVNDNTFYFEKYLGRALKEMSGENMLQLYRGMQAPELLQYRISLANRYEATLQREYGERDQLQSQLASLEAATPRDEARITEVKELVKQNKRTIEDTKNGPDAASLNMLTSLEAMVTMEISARGVQKTATTGTLTSGQVSILAGAEKRQAQDRLSVQSDNYLKGLTTQTTTTSPEESQILAAHQITPAQFRQVINESELTININAQLIYGGPDAQAVFMQDGKLVADPRLKNIFETKTNKGPHYLDRRLFTEHSQSPELAQLDQNGLDPANHPISSALNLNKSTIGAAPSYSNGTYCALVLKDEVKTRTTFTASDSFDAFEQTITTAKLDTLGEALKNLPGGLKLSRKQISDIIQVIGDNTLRADPPQLQFGITHDSKLDFQVSEWISPIISNEDANWTVAVAVLKHFTDKDSAMVSSAANMEKLLPKLSSQQLDTIKQRAQDPEAVNFRSGSYVEGQIYGGVDLTRDVKELRIYDEFLRINSPQYNTLLQFARQLGVPLHIMNMDEASGNQLPAVTVPTTTIPPEVAERDSSFAAFKEEFMGILDLYKAHETSFDYEGLHGREHISRVMIYSLALMNYLAEQGLKFDRYGLMRAIALHDLGREANGPDVFEGASIQKTKDHLASLGLTDQGYIDQVAGLIHTDERTIPSVEDMILHSVDSVDIVRVTGTDGYDRHKLKFGRRNLQQGSTICLTDLTAREELISEAKLLTELPSPVAPEYTAYQQAEELYCEDPEKNQAAYQNAIQAIRDRYQALSSEEIFDSYVAEIKEHPEKYTFISKYLGL